MSTVDLKQNLGIDTTMMGAEEATMVKFDWRALCGKKEMKIERI